MSTFGRVSKCTVYSVRPEDSLCLALIEPGRAYFWKVIAEDGKGGVVEAKLGASRLNRDVRLEYRRATRYLEAFSVL